MRITVKTPKDGVPLRLEARRRGLPITVEVDTAQVTQYSGAVHAYLGGPIVKANGEPGRNRLDVHVELSDIPDAVLDAILDRGQVEVDTLAAQFEELRSEILDMRMERDLT